jgi:hypothetical protein
MVLVVLELVQEGKESNLLMMQCHLSLPVSDFIHVNALVTYYGY